MNTPAYPFAGYQENEDADYCEMQMAILRWESWQACVLAEWMKAQFPHIRYVCDAGCGPGNYLTPYKLLGCQVFGVDACSKGGVLLLPSEFKRMDLRFPVGSWLDGDDLAICFEVAEHIEEKYADTLIDNICNAAPLVLFTGAVPGQGGTFHVNEQPHEYWIEKFADRGYRIHEKQEDMRKCLAALTPLREVGGVSGWLLDNSFLFVKE